MTSRSFRFGPGFLAGLALAISPLASAATYQLDDGIAAAAVKIGSGSSGVLVNQFTAVAGSETITGIEFVWGTASGEDMSNAPFNLVVYRDPNNDGEFNDAVLIYSEAAQLPSLVTNDPVAYHFVSGITFNPGDVFYVGYEEFADSLISIATDAAGGTESWVAWTGTNPATAGSIGRVSSFAPSFARDSMIRALSAPIPEPAAASALTGGLALGGILLRRRRRG